MQKRLKKATDELTEANKANKEVFKLEKKLEEASEKLEEETAAKEYNWETIDLLVNKERELDEEEKGNKSGG